MQSTVLATDGMSVCLPVCLSVCLSICHALVLRQKDASYDHEIFTNG